jgi:hypothetical protein
MRLSCPRSCPHPERQLQLTSAPGTSKRVLEVDMMRFSVVDIPSGPCYLSPSLLVRSGPPFSSKSISSLCLPADANLVWAATTTGGRSASGLPVVYTTSTHIGAWWLPLPEGCSSESCSSSHALEPTPITRSLTVQDPSR